MVSPSGAHDGLKTQLEEQIIDINQKAWDIERGKDSVREPLTADPKVIRKDDYSVEYFDQNHGLMNREADEDLHNQILNELVLANDMAHQNRINQQAIDARMREIMMEHKRNQSN